MQVNIIRMFRQLDYFAEYQRRVSAVIGAQQARQLVNRALVLITVGGNDFVNNYYLVPYSARSRQFTLPNYVKYIISEYRKLLMVIPIFEFWILLLSFQTCSLLENQSTKSKRAFLNFASFYMQYCFCHCRGYTNWEHVGFLWRVPDHWVVFQQSWPWGVPTVDAQLNCKEPHPCTTRNSNKCYKE